MRSKWRRVTRHELETVVQGDGCDLQVGIRKHGAALLEVGADLTEHAGGGPFVGEHGQGGEDALSMFSRCLSRSLGGDLPAAQSCPP
jgi:hypothetical protein